ncbi:MAG: tripartite tricarboxylate transporter TctB family protein [Mailhella sp.]|nr:tripartite tricarboxylate transporter TctB family protein [Mailhella sp.]
MKKSLLDLFLAVLCLAVAVPGILICRQFDGGADIVPMVMFSLLIAFALPIAIMALLRMPHATYEKSDAPLKDRWRPYIAAFTITLYVIMIPVLGFLIASLLFSVVMFFVLNVKKCKLYAFITCCAILFVIALLQFILNVPLPKGMLFS